eukprot:NODE_611_length_1493_cov_354.869806_g458_i0.p1 GENE.NODE_611_length_1493_cov_354.869806_g458_i0~~NODE_611_length_1493_cov_354.869806_g458_i0.p1  ORF type:complete len:397 (-),score=82.44 NODE_611_length_1493_cov_354.869806_g458_i0:301-1440(-)
MGCCTSSCAKVATLFSSTRSPPPANPPLFNVHINVSPNRTPAISTQTIEPANSSFQVVSDSGESFSQLCATDSRELVTPGCVPSDDPSSATESDTDTQPAVPFAEFSANSHSSRLICNKEGSIISSKPRVSGTIFDHADDDLKSVFVKIVEAMISGEASACSLRWTSAGQEQIIAIEFCTTLVDGGDCSLPQFVSKDYIMTQCSICRKVQHGDQWQTLGEYYLSVTVESMTHLVTHIICSSCDSAPARTSSTSPLPTAVEGALQVLTVDDCQLTCRLMDSFVKRCGHDATSLTDPLQVFEYLSHNTVDVLFVDNQMPGMTGVELLEQLGSLLDNVFVVGLSGCGELESAFLAAGAHRFFSKPCTFKTVQDVLKQRIPAQ